MNFIKGVFLSTIFIGNQCAALSCAMPTLPILSTTNVYEDSVFWVDYPHNVDRPDNFIIQSPKKIIRLISEQDTESPNLYKLIPKYNLATNEQYNVSPLKASVSKYFTPYSFKTSSGSFDRPLIWEIYPQLTQMIYEPNGVWGARGSMTFKFKTNMTSDDFLLKIQYTDDPSWKSVAHRIIKPLSGENNESYFNLGFNVCSNFYSVHFKPNQTIYIKFDLITHDGKILKWNGDGITYKIQQKKHNNLDYSTKTNALSIQKISLLQHLINWLNQIFKTEHLK